MRHRFEVQSIDQLVDSELLWEVGFVPQDKKRDAFQSWLLEQELELFTSDRQCFFVGGIDNESASISNNDDSRGRRLYTIAFTPRQYRSHMGRNLGWPPKSQLQSRSKSADCFSGGYIAQDLHCRFGGAWHCRSWMCVTKGKSKACLPLQSDMALLDALHIEAHCRNGAIAERQQMSTTPPPPERMRRWDHHKRVQLRHREGTVRNDSDGYVLDGELSTLANSVSTKLIEGKRRRCTGTSETGSHSPPEL